MIIFTKLLTCTYSCVLSMSKSCVKQDVKREARMHILLRVNWTVIALRMKVINYSIVSTIV